MRRLFWLGVGLAVGVLVVRKCTKTAQSYSPQGIADSAKGYAESIAGSARSFIDDVKSGMAEHENQILEAVAADAEMVK